MSKKNNLANRTAWYEEHVGVDKLTKVTKREGTGKSKHQYHKPGSQNSKKS